MALKFQKPWRKPKKRVRRHVAQEVTVLLEASPANSFSLIAGANERTMEQELALLVDRRIEECDERKRMRDR